MAATTQDLNKTLAEHGYAIVATPDPAAAATALSRAAEQFLNRDEDVRVIDGASTGTFGHLLDLGAVLATTPHAANRELDRVLSDMSRRKKRVGNTAWADISKAVRPDRLVVLIDAYEELTRSEQGIALRLAEKAARIAEEGPAVGVFLVGFMRTVDPAEFTAGVAA